MKPIQRALGCLAILCAATPALADDVVLGVVQALSGPATSVAFGESYLQGIELAIEEHNASSPTHSVTTVVYNDEANPQRSVALVERLISNDGASAIIGTVNSGNVAAFAPLVQEAQVPLMIGPAIATNLTANFIEEDPSFIFRCSMVEAYQVGRLIDWASENFDNIALLHSTSGYGMFAQGEIIQGFEDNGVTLVAVESSGPDATDVTSQTISLQRAGAEVVLVFHERPELFFRAAERIEFDSTVAGNWSFSSSEIRDVIGADAIQGVVMGQALDQGREAVREFDSRMEARYGEDYRWPVVAALGYDAARLMLGAIEQAGPDRAAIRAALESTSDFQAVTAAPAAPYSATDHECLDPETVFLGVWDGELVVRLN